MSVFGILQVITVAALAIYIIKWLLQMYKFQQKVNKLPLYKGAVPFLGHLTIFFGTSNNFWEGMKIVSQAAIDDGFVRLRLGPIDHISVIVDPELAQHLMHHCLNKHYFYKFASCWLGNGIIQADAEVWKVHRKLINPTFSQQVLNGFIGVFNMQSKWLIQEMRPNAGNGLFDPRRKMSEQTLKTVCQTVLGISTEDVIDDGYLDAVDKIFMILAKRMANFMFHHPVLYATTNQKREQDECVKILHNMSKSIMMKRKEERENGQHNEESVVSGKRFTALLDLFLTMNEQGLVDLEQIRMELDTFIAAGHDTTNRAVFYTLIYIGSFPDVQQKIYDELQSVLGDVEFIGKDDLPKLVYTEAVIKESLRVSPVVPFIGRILDRDIVYKNYVFPKGLNAFISLWGIHHNTKLWGPDAGEFKPERWLNPESLPKNPNAYCPFSIGRRNCVGKHYAYMSMKVTLSYLVRNYKITADYTKLKTQFDVLLRATDGYEISLEMRNQDIRN